MVVQQSQMWVIVQKFELLKVILSLLGELWYILWLSGRILSLQLQMRLDPSMLVNSLWPSDAIWRHGFGSTLAQVMACCLTAPSHYLSQWWLIINKVHWHSHKGNFTRYLSHQSLKQNWKLLILRFHSNHPGANESSWYTDISLDVARHSPGVSCSSFSFK